MSKGPQSVFAGQKIRSLRVFPWRSFVLFSAGILGCSLSALGQSQRPPAAPTPVEQQAPSQQPAASINGTVIDGTGAVVSGARVRLTRSDQSLPQEALSGDLGQFAFSDLAPGPFQITITADGFAAQKLSGVLRSGEVYITPPMKLAPATLNTEIEVSARQTEVAQAQIKAQEKQRVFGVVPNFYVSYVSNAAPLSAKQKFELAWKSSIDPVTFALTGVVAGAEQAQNGFAGYGQGAQGYAKRFGAAYVDTATSTFIGSAILPSLLKQDPRYFYKGTGSTRSRILYAIANSVLCKGDNQHWQPNYSAIAGGLAAGGISNLYYPPKDRGAALVFENTLIGTGTTAILNLLQEFVVRKVTPHAQP
ncbi:MAG TPA: carboxypeptidase-like regulatory domain-containing protein [Candidatus Angelobacter sp.]|nr:carboxypeptidase-like regulatory domain-containing protein [Candidatus Angelobacter sp.]